jgi:hypothetical protein
MKGRFIFAISMLIGDLQLSVLVDHFRSDSYMAEPAIFDISVLLGDLRLWIRVEQWTYQLFQWQLNESARFHA